MKSQKLTPANKLVKRFDNELKRLLLSDLISIKTAQKKLVNTFNVA